MIKKYSKFAANLGTYLGASIIPMVFGLLSNPWIAKNMSPEDYAISGYYTSYSSLISPIITFYLIHFYIKEYFRLDDEQRKRLYSTIAKALIWFSGLVSIVCFACILLFLKYLDTDFEFPISPYLALMVFSLPLTGLLNLRLAKLRLQRKASSYFYLSVSNGILNIFLILLFVVVLKLGAFGKLLGPLVCNFTVFVYLLYRFRACFQETTSWKEYIVVFKFCLPLAISAMLGYFTHGFTTTYLESMGDVNEYGIYVVGSSIAGYLTVFGTAINNTFQPDVFEAIVNSKWVRYIKLCASQLALISFIVVTFIFLAPFLIDILTAGCYVSSTIYAQIISISTVTRTLYFLINNFSIATNRPNLYLYTTIIGSISMIILLPIVVREWGFIGGSWMIVGSFLIYFFANSVLLFVAKYIKPLFHIN